LIAVNYQVGETKTPVHSVGDPGICFDREFAKELALLKRPGGSAGLVDRLIKRTLKSGVLDPPSSLPSRREILFFMGKNPHS
jgi:hypothetical protein